MIMGPVCGWFTYKATVWAKKYCMCAHIVHALFKIVMASLLLLAPWVEAKSSWGKINLLYGNLVALIYCLSWRHVDHAAFTACTYYVGKCP